ncbi:hypothetical protein [Actinoplanes ianthinogenes]|nr:hypothetical protein [Actinoplanes ianthinogenes]
MGWERPLDGVEDVAWDELLAGSWEREASGERVVGLLRDIAAGQGDPASLDDLLLDDADYFYTESGTDSGYVAAMPEALRFLARIAAAPATGDRTRVAIIEQIEEMCWAPIDAEGATEAELDARVDTLRAALLDSREALDEVVRLAPHTAPRVARRLAALGAGAYEPRWRGIARPLGHERSYRIASAGPLVLVGGDRFLDPADGTVLATVPPGRGSGVALTDPEGPCFVRRGRAGGLVVWRHRQGNWQRTRVGLPWPLGKLFLTLAADGDELYGWTVSGAVGRVDPRSGRWIGAVARAPRAAENGLHPYRIGDRRFAVMIAGYHPERSVFRLDLTRGSVDRLPIENVHRCITSFRSGLVFNGPRGVRRFDAESGAEIGDPIPASYFSSGCSYEIDGRSYLAIGDIRQIRRVDAETGEPVGAPLPGHRREITAITAAIVAGRPTLISVDGATVRRWDAETGTPWPAPLPE